MRQPWDNVPRTSAPTAPHRSVAQRLGLRAKFNIVLVPLVALALSVLVVLDYRHEFRSVMDAHDIHAGRLETPAAAAPVQARTTPEAVADRTLTLHAIAGTLTLIALVVGVNLTLSRLVLTPIARVRAGIEQLQRGFRSGDTAVVSSDEVRGVAAAFDDLGLTLDAMMLHALQTERLATLALLSKTVAADIEPEVQRLGVAAAGLQQAPDAATRDAAHEIAGGAARILAAVRRLDRPFGKPVRKPAA